MSVMMYPGATALTVTPRRASSLAVTFVRAMSAGFGGGVVGLPGTPENPADGGNVDDPAGTLLHHGLGRQLGSSERPPSG